MLLIVWWEELGPSIIHGVRTNNVIDRVVVFSARETHPSYVMCMKSKHSEKSCQSTERISWSEIAYVSAVALG